MSDPWTDTRVILVGSVETDEVFTTRIGVVKHLYTSGISRGQLRVRWPEGIFPRETIHDADELERVGENRS